MEVIEEKKMTGKRDDTRLHGAGREGNIEEVMHILNNTDEDELKEMLLKQNQAGETALYSASQYGQAHVILELISYYDPISASIKANNGYDAFHVAAKHGHLGIYLSMLLKSNTALHIASRKGRCQIITRLLAENGTDTTAVNRAGETALDTAEKMNNPDVAAILSEHGVQSAKVIKPQVTSTNRELKQTVSDIKHEVHYQLEHTRQTRKRVQGIAKRLNKMHAEGLNNAINSTTVVAVLIATVAFAAIFTVPVQTSVVVIESKAKKQMMAIINKLMWLACVLISVSFLALSFIVVGAKERWLAIGVTIIGTTIMATTLGTMCYWVIQHRMEARNLRKSSLDSRSRSYSISAMSDSELHSEKFKKMYAI